MPVVLSKLFAEALRHQSNTCHHIIHPANSCATNNFINFYQSLLSNAKYFAAIVFLPLLLKLRKLNRQSLLKTLEYYLETVFIGTLTSVCIIGGICSCRRIFGYKYYTFVYLPTFMGAFATFLARQRVRTLFYTSVFQCTLESLLMKRKNIVTKSLANSIALRTIIFCGCSALILRNKQKSSYHRFWILTPNEVISQKNQEINVDSSPTLPKKSNLCTHKEKCSRHFFNGIQIYFLIGLTLDLINVIKSKTVSGKFGKFTGRSTALMISYMGIYRFTNCYLNRLSKTTPDFNHFLAAFLGGISYIFQPKLNLFSYGAVLSIEILWHKFKDMWSGWKVTKSSKKYGHLVTMANEVISLPYARILYPFSLAYLVHTYVLRKHLFYISPMGATIINAITGNYALRVNSYIQQIEKLMEAGRIAAT